MNIPLTPDEVKIIQEASAFLNGVYHNAFNTLAALTADGNMRDPRVALLSLGTSCDALREVRSAVGESPYLTDDHVADILAIQDTITKEFANLGERRMTQAVEALDGGVVDASVIEVIRHAGLSKERIALSKLGKLFDMVEKKMAPPGTPPHGEVNQR